MIDARVCDDTAPRSRAWALARSNGLFLDRLNKARVIFFRPDTLTRFDTGHMRKWSFSAGRNKLGAGLSR